MREESAFGKGRMKRDVSHSMETHTFLLGFRALQPKGDGAFACVGVSVLVCVVPTLSERVKE